MKRILITGANSYIGTSVEKYLSQWPEDYEVDTIDMTDDSWKEYDFSPYNVVYHVAGIAHIKETKENKSLYYQVNRDLAYETAKKAKAEGVKQFIFMSSMSVYGMNTGVIEKDTEPNPLNNYGKSKLQAEQLLSRLIDDTFLIAIIRPPMIYGKGCKGNYTQLETFARNLPIFPRIKNKRSMLYIGNLCQFVKLIIENKESGLFFPQNGEYTNTSEMVKRIAQAKDHKILMIPGMSVPVRILMKIPGRIGEMLEKAFGSLIYEMSMSGYKENYRVFTLEESIQLTEEN